MDERRRRLERARARAEPGAGAALLVERVRAGEVERDRVKLAAYLGDPDARVASGERFKPLAVEVWVEGLSAWGVEPWRDEVRALAAPTWRDQLLPRVAVALARAVRPAEESDHRVRIDAALEAAEAWLARPSVDAATTARTTFTTVRASAMPVEMACLATLHVCPKTPRLTVEIVGSLLGELWAQAKERAGRPGGPAGVMARVVRESLGELGAREAVRGALVPFALGGSSP